MYFRLNNQRRYILIGMSIMTRNNDTPTNYLAGHIFS